MRTAVLFSGGLDSAILLADEAARGSVQPVYVSTGLAWEPTEQAVADAFVASLDRPGVPPLVRLRVDMSDVYAATHWAVQGRPPAYDTPDEDVYLPGRNIILLSKAAVYAAAAGLDRIVIGTLAHNPFPDATPEFREAIARAVTLGLAHPLAIDAPYAEVEKADVIRRGAQLGARMDLTLSCMNPKGLGIGDWGLGDTDHSSGVRSQRIPDHQSLSDQPLIPNPQSPPHCGACSKCRERHDAFAAAGIADPTSYAVRPPR